jgi:hypothetical protein
MGGPRLRYVETTLRELGVDQDSTMRVHQAHLEGCTTLEEAVDVYRGVFDLGPTATVQILSHDMRTTIRMGAPGTTIVKTPRSMRILVDEMVVHR